MYVERSDNLELLQGEKHIRGLLPLQEKGNVCPHLNPYDFYKHKSESNRALGRKEKVSLCLKLKTQ